MKNQLHDLIINKLKEIKEIQNNIKLDDLEYTRKRRKNNDFSKYKRYMHEESFSLEDADKLDQIQLINKFKDVGKDKIPFEKVIFKKMSDYLLVQEEKFLIYKSKIFSR